ncbi:hypothetical protein NMY22_g12026 [Coprinellus aureogranulatus]|nr:hypothetical protein NMY22_g12026 [Coprinellus aureogranulatus]
MLTMNGRFAQAEANGDTHVKVQKEFTNAQPFFTSMRTIPTLSFTLQNLLMSMGTMLVSFSGLVFTATVVLPLSILRTVAPKDMLTKAPGDPGMRMRGKVVLIVGASRGDWNGGLEAVRMIVLSLTGVSSSELQFNLVVERLENGVASLGGTPARIHTAVVDLSWPSDEIAKAVTTLDEEYGPISHLYSVGGISNHLENDKPFDLYSF